MCLYVDKSAHKKFFGIYIPRIAWTNIHVYKYLMRSLYNEEVIISPFQFKIYFFSKGICNVKDYSMPLCRIPFIVGEIMRVRIGIHSMQVQQDDLFDRCSCYNAIIPRFSFYWIGKENDIVSNRLTVFTNSRWSIWKKNHKFKEFKYD